MVDALYATPETASGETHRLVIDKDVWFDLDPEPRLAIGFDGSVQSSNSAAQDALGRGVIATDYGGVLRFGSPESDGAFMQGLRTVSSGRSGRHRMILRGRDGAWLAAAVYRVAGQPRAILALRSEERPPADALSALADAFHLTRAEAGVLCALTDGKCPKAVANDMNISEHTVRAHLRSIYAKMGVRGLTGALRRSCNLLF